MAHIIPHPLVELRPQVQPAVAGGSVCMVPYGRATACTEGEQVNRDSINMWGWVKTLVPSEPQNSW